VFDNPKKESTSNSGKAVNEAGGNSPPAISLPGGGGAIHGIGEKFAANPVTGTGSMSVPIATSPGRSGFGPQLALRYDSGVGNGPFGLGWNLALPMITRKTDKGLPQYHDALESDVFLLSGAEDLVPTLVEKDGKWVREALAPGSIQGIRYHIQRYCPRVEGLFARIERWTSETTGESFWRSISKDNITAYYGNTSDSRIADPADPLRIFSWLICESYDDKGNAIRYTYKAENSEGILPSLAQERNRGAATRSAQRYLKRIQYGNLAPHQPEEDLSQRTDWLFETVFDYGEHDEASPDPNDALATPTANARPWPVRKDPFSSYRAGFEARTYRLCRRVLMFHHFPDLPTGEKGYDGLVRSTDFTYSFGQNPTDTRKTIYSMMLSVTQSGYDRMPNAGYLKRSLPPVEFVYSDATIDPTVREADSTSLENLPVGLDGAQYRWVDLEGEGISGILTEQADGWFYKRNLSPLDLMKADGVERKTARFAPIELVSTQPALRLGAGKAQFLDLAGKGQPDVVTLHGPAPGFYERATGGEWETFTPFTSLPTLDWDDPNLKFVDLTGDGLADVLITQDQVFQWHPSLAEEGFGPQKTAWQFFDEEQGPKLVFADGTQSIYLADMSGDGLTDLVRIRNGEVCYWPNIGYGSFGAKVTMDNAPWFDYSDLFSQKRIRLADIDGSGTMDILYLGSNQIAIYRNQSGNAWSDRELLTSFPRIDDLSAVQAVDLMGNGTACLVWSSSLPGDAQRPLRYIDLMGGQKPHLLIRTKNNLGGETEIQYAPSTKFYLADKFAGTPWITKLPFPVQCVEKVTVRDQWRGTTFSATYSYHHGYFDGLEREFRGFGRVEQVDVEDYGLFAAANIESPYITADQTLYQPPVKTVTWFHTGAALDRTRILNQFQHEYFPTGYDVQAGFHEKPLPEPDLDAQNLSADEWREALRACKGMVLRQEVYELDVDALQPAAGTPARQVPVRLFSAAAHNCRIRCLQHQGENRHAVFFVTESEALTYQYELALPKDPAAATPLQPDPRIAHTLNLRRDEYGNPQQSVAVAYSRRMAAVDPSLSDAQIAQIGAVQAEQHIAYSETHYTADVITQSDPTNPASPIRHYRLRLPCEAQTFELTRIARADRNYFGLEDFRLLGLSQTYPPELRPGETAISVGPLPYHQLANGPSPQMRLVENTRTLYFKDSDGISQPTDPLPLGQHGPRGLKYEDYKLALTRDLLDRVFRDASNADLLAREISSGVTVRSKLNDASVSGYLSGAALAARFPGIDSRDQYWVRSGIAGFAPDAAQHFYLPERYTDPFGNVTTLQYDGRDLFIQASTDARGNTTRVIAFDYRLLAPSEMEDVNGNHSEAAFDILGHVIAVAMKGKPIAGGWEGDDLSGFESSDLCNPLEADVQAFCNNTVFDEGQARTWLGRASTRFVYHFGETRDAAGNVTAWETRPAGACSILREIHASAVGGAGSPLQVSLECSDGSGNVLMKKVQAEPVVGQTTLRWIINGLTVLNNKAKPIKQYEPAFSADFGCEMPQANGVTPVMTYDAAGRLIRTDLPDGTLSRVAFSPWHVASFDPNDTVLESLWYAQRAPDSSAVPEEKRAAALAAQHADTPALTILDSLGREVISIAFNRVKNAAGQLQDERDTSFTKVDAEGKPLWIRDARGNLVMQHIMPPKLNNDPSDLAPIGSVPCYDIAGNLLYQHSMDSGDCWTINDAAGKPMFAWDFNQRQDVNNALLDEQRLSCADYDNLHRPTALWLRINTDPALMVERYEYRDAQDNDPQALQNNLLGQLVRHYDPSGCIEMIRLDFKGSPLEVQRRLIADRTASVTDWQTNPDANLEAETFVQITEYDALKRMTRLYNWHRGAGSRVAVYEPVYSPRGVLQSEKLTIQATKTANGFSPGPNTRVTNAITEIRYNVKGQKELQRLGNGVVTANTYDPTTFRLLRIKSARPVPAGDACSGALPDPTVLQDLNYTYDPVGNITEIEDLAQKVGFFQGQQITAGNRYEYDALYRLIAATGRESGASTGAPRNLGDAPTESPCPIPDPAAMRNYTETYRYDAVGNILEMRHTAGSQGSWTRSYQYAPDSNRLTGTNADNPAEAIAYLYDTHGNMRNLANVSSGQYLRWDHRDMIGSLDLAGGGWAYYQYDTGKQRTRKTLARNGGTLEERIYLGGYELYRRYNAQGIVVEEIETLHLVDGQQRLLMVDQVIQTDRPALGKRNLFRYTLSNHLGSSTVELDENAAIISYEEYHPYGTTAYQSGRNAAEVQLKRYRYTGMERDEESGLSYHGARYYALWLPRWTSTDPKGLTDGVNLYEYTQCRPISVSDPSGMQGESHSAEQRATEHIKAVLGIDPHELARRTGLGPISIVKLEQILIESKILPELPKTSQPSFTYAGPSADVLPQDQSVVGRIILYTDPEGGSVPVYERGTESQLEQRQDDANRSASEMMGTGLMMSVSGLKKGSATSGVGLPVPDGRAKQWGAPVDTAPNPRTPPDVATEAKSYEKAELAAPSAPKPATTIVETPSKASFNIMPELTIWGRGNEPQGRGAERALEDVMPGTKFYGAFPNFDRAVYDVGGPLMPALEIGQLKSIDTSLKSSQGRGLYRKVMKAAGELAGPGESIWTHGGHQVIIGPNTARVLDIALPYTPLTEAQTAALNEATADAQSMGVTVMVHRVW